MKIFSKLILLLFCLNISNCRYGSKNEILDIESIVNYKTNSVVLQAGYYDTSLSQYIQFNDGKLYRLSLLGNLIYVYPIYNKNEVITYDSIVVDSKINGFIITNSDTIFANNNTIYKDKIVYKFNRKDSNLNYIRPTILNYTPTPIYYLNQNFILIGSVFGETCDTDIIRYNGIKIINNRIKNIIPFNTLQSSKNWGGNQYRMVYSCLIEDKGLIYLSLPLSHNIILYNFNNDSVSEIEAKSKYLSSIKYIECGNVSFKNSIKYFNSTDSYNSIFYDKYRKVIYRFYQVRINRNIVNGVMIIDKENKNIKELRIPDNYSINNVFINQSGLNLLNKIKSNDEKIHYDNFNINYNY